MNRILFLLLLLSGLSAQSQVISYPDNEETASEHFYSSYAFKVNTNRLSFKTTETAETLKSGNSSIKYRLDSIVSTVNEKYIFSYSGTGNPDSQTWYNSGGQPLERREFSYDQAGRILLNTQYTWDNNGLVWTPAERTESSYTIAGKIEEIINSSWDMNLLQFKPIRKTNYLYDILDREIQRDVYDWDDSAGSWEIKFSYATSYNASGQILTETVSSSNFLTNIMELNYRYDYYYNTTFPSFIDSALGYTYDQTNSAWIYSTFVEYNMTNSLTGDYISILYGYDAINGLIPQYKFEVLFDTAGNIIDQSTYMYWNGFPNWKPIGRVSGSFDNNVPVTDLYIPPDYSVAHKYILRTIYARGSTTFIPLYDFIYYWSPLSTGLAESEMSNITVFPNPASELLNIQTGADGEFRFSIHDISGSLVHEQVIENNTAIDIRHLRAGVYHWQLTEARLAQTGKLIKLN